MYSIILKGAIYAMPISHAYIVYMALALRTIHAAIHFLIYIQGIAYGHFQI